MHLEINNVSKIYNNGHQALTDFSLSLEPGVLGLLGPNGAGKSTLMKIISTITNPTSGTILFNGINIAESPDTIRNVLGYLPQDFGVYPKLTARQYLQYIGALKGLQKAALNERIELLLDMVNLGHVEEKRKLSQFSGGMRQRVGIAQALLNDPQILIVDEPTVGLDPSERARFARLLTEMSDDRIIVFSTHIVSDIEATAERVALIKQGYNVVDGSPDIVMNAVQGRVFEDIITPTDYKLLQKEYQVTATKRQADGVYVRYFKRPEQPSFNNSTAVAPTLEEAYLYYAH